MTELEALRRVAEAARDVCSMRASRVAEWSDVSNAIARLDEALINLGALPAPQPTPARSRLAALEALRTAVWDYDRGTGRGDVRWSDVTAALAAVDDSPAPAAEPEGEVVDVVADVFGDNDGFFVRERGHIPLPHNLHIATIRARVPLPRVPDVVGEVG